MFWGIGKARQGTWGVSFVGILGSSKINKDSEKKTKIRQKIDRHSDFESWKLSECRVRLKYKEKIQKMFQG